MKDIKTFINQINEGEWRFEDIKPEIQSLTNSLFYDKGLKGTAKCYPIKNSDEEPTNEEILTHFFDCIKEVLDRWDVNFEYKLS